MNTDDLLNSFFGQHATQTSGSRWRGFVEPKDEQTLPLAQRIQSRIACNNFILRNLPRSDS